MNEMIDDQAELARIRAILDVCESESNYLLRCDARLFASRLDSNTILQLPDNDEIAERVDAFVARFGRMQDTLGDKLVPVFLKVMQEKPGTMLENLDRLERLGLVESADAWISLRKLRNRMIHEYVKDPAELAEALNAAHDHVPMLINTLAMLKNRIAAKFPNP